MKRTPEGVTIELTEDQFERLVYALGIAAGASAGSVFWRFIELANTVNEGNPKWTPYEIEKDIPE